MVHGIYGNVAMESCGSALRMGKVVGLGDLGWEAVMVRNCGDADACVGVRECDWWGGAWVGRRVGNGFENDGRALRDGLGE
jgi:hypothetical protein